MCANLTFTNSSTTLKEPVCKISTMFPLEHRVVLCFHIYVDVSFFPFACSLLLLSPFVIQIYYMSVLTIKSKVQDLPLRKSRYPRNRIIRLSFVFTLLRKALSPGDVPWFECLYLRAVITISGSS